jgi:hypothetical protein
MSLGHMNFDEIVEKDLYDLIVTGIPEGMAIEYKRDPYGRADADIKEFLKDVTALANAIGGHIVIGMEETNGIPTSLVAISSVDRDAEIQRLESLIRDGIEPRILGVHIRGIDIASGGYALVLRVPRSWNPPHRVTARGTNRFYIRNSAGAHEASVEELRVLFNLSATAGERARGFRAERLGKISAGEGPVPLAADRGRLIIHIVPLSAFSNYGAIDIEDALKHRAMLSPIASTDGMTPKFNFEGFINVRGGTPCFGYTQVFRNGAIEATLCSVLNEYKNDWWLPSIAFEQWVISAIRTYPEGMKLLGIEPPLIVMLTLEGMHGAILGVGQDRMLYDKPEAFTRSTLELPEIILQNYGKAEDYVRSIRPAIDAVWNAGGYSKSPHFDEAGNWNAKAV